MTQDGPAGFTRHDLDGLHLFWEGRLPEELLPGVDAFEALWAIHPEEYPIAVIHGGPVPMPRWQKAYGHDYHFSGRTSVADPVLPELLPFLEWAQGTIDDRLNGILVNWYLGTKGHYIGAHRDKTVGLVPGSPIVTISLGETRTFRLRPWKGKGFMDFAAENGVVFIVPWDTNRAWTHEVPRAARRTGRRISVTLRAFGRGSRGKV